MMMNARTCLAEEIYSGAGGDRHHPWASHVKCLFTYERHGNPPRICIEGKRSDNPSPENHSILFLATEVNIEAPAQLKIVFRSKMLN